MYQTGVAPPFYRGNENTGGITIYKAQPSVGYVDDGNIGMTINTTIGRRYWINLKRGDAGDCPLDLYVFGYHLVHLQGQNVNYSNILWSTATTIAKACIAGGSNYGIVTQFDIVDVEALYAYGYDDNIVLAFMNANCRGMDGTKSIAL